MNRYEILILAVPHMTEDEAGSIERAIEKIVKNVPGSTLLSFDKWGKVKLAYEIGKDESGLYFLVRFELADPKALFDQVHMLLTTKYSDSVIRHLTKKMDPREPLVYERPEVTEDSSTRDVSDFLRKNKMEGLLSSVEGGESRPDRGDRPERRERSDRGDRPRYSSYNSSGTRPPRRDDSAPSVSTTDKEEVSA